MTDPTDAETILIDHQRMDSSSCLCGWGELGRSFAGHQVAKLREAGLLVADTQKAPVRPSGQPQSHEPAPVGHPATTAPHTSREHDWRSHPGTPNVLRCRVCDAMGPVQAGPGYGCPGPHPGREVYR